MKHLDLRQFTILADAYGPGTYGCGAYNEGCTATEQGGSGNGNGNQPPGGNAGQNGNTGQNGGILAPDTGLFAQPPIILYPSIVLIGIIIGTLSFLISRQIKKLRKQ